MATASDRQFGMALGQMGMPPSDIPDYFSFPHFQAVELPVEYWNGRSLHKTELASFRSVFCGNIMEPTVSRAIVHAPEQHRKKFAEEAVRIAEKLHKKGVKTITLDCGMEDILGNRESEDALRGILRGIAPFLLKADMTLLLPFRAPSEKPPAEACRFLRNTLLPCVKARLDIHPCEKEVPAPDISGGSLFWELRLITFLYNADCGNRVQKKQIEPWLSWSEQFGKHVPLLLAPLSQRQRMSFPEATAWEQTASEILNQ